MKEQSVYLGSKFIGLIIGFIILTSLITYTKTKLLNNIEGTYHFIKYTDSTNINVEISILILKNDYTYSYSDYKYQDEENNSLNNDTASGIWKFIEKNEIELTNFYYFESDTNYWLGNIMPYSRNMFINHSMYIHKPNTLSFSSDANPKYFFKKIELFCRREKKIINSYSNYH